MFDGAVTSVTGGPAGEQSPPGTIAVVFDESRDFVGLGLWDANSPIRVTMLHRGKPATINEDFFRERLEQALDIRRNLAASSHTDGYRLINGENDQFPGLVLDKYGQTGVLKLYRAAWFPHLAMLLPLIADVTGLRHMVLRLGRNVADGECFGLHNGQTIYGEPEEPTLFREHDLRFEAHPFSGQKTGHFLDQRDNRVRVGTMSAGKSVLDMFACTGGFSVHAAAGGARSVTSVDLNASAMGTAIRNMELNKERRAVAQCDHKTIVGDAFEVMVDLQRQKRSYDIVVIDPPSFAQRQENVKAGLKAYKRLTELGLDLLNRGGVLVQASCSSRITAEMFHEAIDQVTWARRQRLIDIVRTEHAVDHPVNFAEGAYLKARFARIDG